MAPENNHIEEGGKISVTCTATEVSFISYEKREGTLKSQARIESTLTGSPAVRSFILGRWDN